MRILYLDENIKFVVLDGVRLGIVYATALSNDSPFAFEPAADCPERLKAVAGRDYPDVHSVLLRVRELADTPPGGHAA